MRKYRIFIQIKAQMRRSKSIRLFSEGRSDIRVIRGLSRTIDNPLRVAAFHPRKERSEEEDRQEGATEPHRVLPKPRGENQKPKQTKKNTWYQ